MNRVGNENSWREAARRRTWRCAEGKATQNCWQAAVKSVPAEAEAEEAAVVAELVVVVVVVVVDSAVVAVALAVAVVGTARRATRSLPAQVQSDSCTRQETMRCR